MSEPDATQIEKTEEKMVNAVKKLREISPLVGAAKAIINFDSERRKNALAKAQMTYILRGESVAGSEACARNNVEYLETINNLKEQFTEAERQILEYDVTRISWETARSLLAQQRESMKTLGG